MKSRKWRSLLHKVEYLKLDLEDKEDAIKEIEAQFLIRLHELAPASIQQPPGEKSPEGSPPAARVEVIDGSPEGSEEKTDGVDAEITPDERPDDMRKIWRSIAVATHPDKTGGDPAKTDLYKRASGAWEGRRYEELISIAMELGVDVGEAGEGSETLLEVRSKEISDRISMIEGSVLWQWHRAPPEKKDAIVKLYASSKRRG